MPISSVEKRQSSILEQSQARIADGFKQDKHGTSFEDTRTKSSKEASGRYTKSESSNSGNLATDSFEKILDFVIKSLLASVQNTDPTSESSGSQSSEMLTTATAIANVNSAKDQVAKMNEMMEAIKNPGYNALDIQGKEVSYDSNKSFNGSDPISFKYNVSCREEYKDATVSTIIKVKNSDGKIVYETKGSGKIGDNEFEWNGYDKKGKKLPAGSYSIEVIGKGSRNVGGNWVDFNVDATSLNKAIVESVEIENGVATKLILSNGEHIDKAQVVRVKDISKSKNSVELSSDLIGNFIEFDLTRTQVIAGDMEVYYNNHIENPGKATIKISDSKGKLVKTFDSNEIKKKGIGSISFAKTGLESGNYTVEIVVEDNNKSGTPEKLKTDPVTLLAKGIDYINQTVIAIDENDVEVGFKTHNINAVVGDFSRLTARAEQYLGKTINYDDSVFEFKKDYQFDPVLAERLDGATISHEELRIYDENGQQVAELKGYIDPFDLDENSLNALKAMQGYKDADNGSVKNLYIDSSNDNKVKLSIIIVNNLEEGKYKFKEKELNDGFKKGFVELRFPVWDGRFTMGEKKDQEASVGQIFTTARATIHVKSDGSTVGANPHPSLGLVESYSINDDGEISLKLSNGKTIKESQILKD
jgi:flagellar basal-body rod modification protein FlgD